MNMIRVPFDKMNKLVFHLPSCILNKKNIQPLHSYIIKFCSGFLAFPVIIKFVFDETNVFSNTDWKHLL